MAVCAFLGHEDVYDPDIETRLQAAVDRIAAENETVEFLLNYEGRFFYYCLLAVLRARTRHPQTVTITVAYRKAYYEHYIKGREGSVLHDIVDKITAFDTETKNVSYIVFQRKMLQWLIHQSTHLIMYVYEKFREKENQALDCVRAKAIAGSLTVIDISAHETEQAIMDSVPLLTEQEQTAFHKTNEGCTLKEIGKILGISGERTRHILHHGCRTIMNHLRQSCYQIQKEKRDQKPRICGIFSLEKPTFESLVQFESIIQFLASMYNVKHFCVEHRLTHSGYIYPLICQNSSLRSIHVTAVTNEGLLNKNELTPDNMIPYFCPPCNAVKCVNSAEPGDNDGVLTVLTDIMDNCDFCICDLSTTPNAEVIENYSRLLGGPILFDIRKNDVGIK